MLFLILLSLTADLPSKPEKSTQPGKIDASISDKENKYVDILGKAGLSLKIGDRLVFPIFKTC